MSQEDLNQLDFKPFVGMQDNVVEVAWEAVILGVIFSVVFGFANAYLGLKFGMTVSTSIPAAVISMTVLRMLFEKATVLENNMVRTVGSAGESLATGIIFTVSAFFIWSADWTLVAAGYSTRLP